MQWLGVRLGVKAALLWVAECPGLSLDRTLTPAPERGGAGTMEVNPEGLTGDLKLPSKPRIPGQPLPDPRRSGQEPGRVAWDVGSSLL